MGIPLTEIVDKLRSTKSAKDKKSILVEHAEDARWLALCQYTYNPHITFPLAYPDVIACDAKGGLPMQSPNALLESLKNREMGFEVACATVRRFTEEHPNAAPLLPLVLGRDLLCGVTPQMLQEVYGGTFDTSSVTNPVAALPDLTASPWLAAQRPPGVFVAALKHGGSASTATRDNDNCGSFTAFMSRCGRMQYMSLRLIENELRKIPQSACYLGHVCLVVDGKHVTDGMDAVLSGASVVENVHFAVHDMLTPMGYCQGRQSGKRSDRLRAAKVLFDEFKVPEDVVRLVKHLPLQDASHLDKLKQSAKTRDWDMLVLRRDADYDRTDADVEVSL